MNTKNLKAYAPKARTQFIEAVRKRAAHFGIYEDRIEEVRIEGSAAIIDGRAFTRKEGEQRKRLEGKVTERGYDMFIREMAYTWFNRLAALRYMEIHDYFDHGFRVLSHPTNPDSLPEILSHASDVADSLDLDKSQIIELQLAGDKEEELYRELLLGQCHQLAKIMPFVFKGISHGAIDDATELLLPNNLTKTDSILKGLINEIPEEDWQEIEVIGWLYQFYISEHKDTVIGKVVKSEDIPAATQLFTPNWIVKYLVQNSVGRQWLATYPNSDLKGKMEYYIEPAEQSEEVIEQLKAITPTSIDPEEIKVLDPACGSGHILVEVYEVLREIYLERGYRLREIPELILTKNIYGLDIDDRAAQLAGFALMMKAREDDRRIFQRVEDGEVSLNVFSLQSSEHLDIPKLWKALDLEGNQQTGSTGGLFDGLSDDSQSFVQPTGIYNDYFELLQSLKSAFLQAKTLGSLIQVEHQHLNNLRSIKSELEEKIQSSDPAAKQAALDILHIINQAILLSIQYDAVVANPPYMGMKGMNSELKDFVKKYYPVSKSDLFAVYIEKCLDFCNGNGKLGLVTPYVWMFISSYEKLREQLLKSNSLTSLIQLEYNAFAPACIPVCTFTIDKFHISNSVGTFIRLSDFKGHETQAPKTLEAINDREVEWIYDTRTDDLLKLPSKSIAYWLENQTLSTFSNRKVSAVTETEYGIITGDNEKYLRYWFEVSKSSARWVNYNKGGTYRKWFGNIVHVIDWKSNQEFVNYSGPQNLADAQFYGKTSITWSDVTSSYISFRIQPEGHLSSNTGPTAVTTDFNTWKLLAFLNSRFIETITPVLNPTMHFTLGDFGNLPLPNSLPEKLEQNARTLVEISNRDWNKSELSQKFIFETKTQGRLSDAFTEEYEKNKDIISRFIKLERENEALISNTLDVEINENDFLDMSKVTLSVNDKFKYGVKEKFPKDRRCSEFITDQISFFIGSAMGRYSLDREGLIYAHSGSKGFKELVEEGAYQTFPADDDGIIPLASEEWLFDDDATTRFKEFVKTVWGNEHLSENIEFVAESLCLHALKPKKGESAMDTVRRYFSTQFFKDHCKTYKKRPIYWLFSSGKEKAFECLVYLHRYNEGTLSRMRTEYVTPLMGKYDAQHTLLSEQQLQATGTEARRIEKDLKSLEKKQAELRTFDEQLKHYAEMRIPLDLDDGVKANYGKFGNLLADVKAIHGKAVK